MSYIEKSLSEDERIKLKFKIHPFIKFWAIFLIAAGSLFSLLFLSVIFIGDHTETYEDLISILIATPGIIATFKGVGYLCTEAGATTKRIIYKTGFIARDTQEMQTEAIESVIFNQSLLGRMFGYATLTVRGVGVGSVDVRWVSHPLKAKRDIESINNI